MSKQVLIVDDEYYARQELRTRLSRYDPDLVIFEADSLDSAMVHLQRQDIRLLFLDIQLMGETGFELFERTEVQAEVIFVTAYEEHALRAFEVNARDYLLKPVSQQRFEAAMAKVRRPLQPPPDQPRRLNDHDRIIEQTVEGLKVIPLTRILAITAEDDYSRIHLAGGRSFLVTRKMKSWQEMLPESTFYRIHRSTLINKAHIESIEKKNGKQHQLTLTGMERPFSISRNQIKGLQTR